MCIHLEEKGFVCMCVHKFMRLEHLCGEQHVEDDDLCVCTVQKMHRTWSMIYDLDFRDVNI